MEESRRSGRRGLERKIRHACVELIIVVHDDDEHGHFSERAGGVAVRAMPLEAGAPAASPHAPHFGRENFVPIEPAVGMSRVVPRDLRAPGAEELGRSLSAVDDRAYSSPRLERASEIRPQMTGRSDENHRTREKVRGGGVLLASQALLGVLFKGGCGHARVNS